MAELDLCIKNLLRDRAKFADMFNAEVFGGKQVLKVEDLTPVSEESYDHRPERDGADYSEKYAIWMMTP